MDSSSSPERPNIERGEFLEMKRALRDYGRGGIRRKDGVQSKTQRAIMENREIRMRTYGRMRSVPQGAAT